MATATAANTTVIRYEPRGGAYALFQCRDPLVCMDGPAGTGKTLAALQKIHLALWKYPGAHGFLARKTLTSLKASTLVTFREQVLHPGEGVKFWTSKGDEPMHYAYPNGSKLMLFGLDKPDKNKSTAYDIGLVDEATDCVVEDVETLSTRMRRGTLPYQQILLCVNPGPPHHWLKQQLDAGLITRILSRHDDNPTITEDYLRRLRALTGVRYARLFLGQWAAAENAVYADAWDAARNLVNRFPIPREWPRYISVDFGFRNPCVVQWWAKDHDGRLYLYREIYVTRATIEDVAKQTKQIHDREKEPFPYAAICDHDLGERAIFERYTGWQTTAAIKDVLAGINAVAQRMQEGRLLIMRDCLVQRDPALVAARLPTCTAEEVEGYVWDANKERPVKENDHGLDNLRYQVTYHDITPGDVTYGPKLF